MNLEQFLFAFAQSPLKISTDQAAMGSILLASLLYSTTVVFRIVVMVWKNIEAVGAVIVALGFINLMNFFS